jgi:DnaK suppressor protein
MDDARARELLAAERSRIEAEIAELGSNNDDQDLQDVEIAQGRIEDLQQSLEDVARAEQRLAEGTYGRSVESGAPIPDERLEAVPTAERTVEEEARFSGRA